MYDCIALVALDGHMSPIVEGAGGLEVIEQSRNRGRCFLPPRTSARENRPGPMVRLAVGLMAICSGQEHEDSGLGRADYGRREHLRSAWTWTTLLRGPGTG